VAVHVALIRAVNLGATTTVSMADLKAGLEEAGASDVRTYLRSGNVVLTSPLRPPKVAALVAGVVEDRAGFRPAVIVRSPAQLRAAVERDPFTDRTDDPTRLHVFFCEKAPAAAALRAIDPERIAPDEIAHRGREIFGYFPNGIGRTKVPLDEKSLGTALTARNLRTVRKLVELAG
jgi:uncharacterized protein (DUF1697 family)